MPRNRREIYQHHAAGVRSFVMDHMNPLVVGNPYYARKLREAAENVARRKRALRGASSHNRDKIQRGLEHAEYEYREKVIFWSIKNAMRAIEVPLAPLRELWGVLKKYVHVLVFLAPSFQRHHQLRRQYASADPKQRRYAMVQVKEITRAMNAELDALIGVRKRRRFVYYFSQLFEGADVYKHTVVSHRDDPTE